MLKPRKLLTLALTTLLLFTAIPVAAFAQPAEPFALGNTPTNSLHGGTMVSYNGTFFWADHTGIYANDTLLTNEAGRHLNVLHGGLYFTTGDGPTILHRFDLTSGATTTVLTWDTAIDQLYIVSDGMVLLLSEGRVHRINRTTHATTIDNAVYPVVGFIPTPYGTIYATGQLGDYRLYADDRLIEAGVSRFFTEDDALIVRRGTENFEANFRNLFIGAITLTAYQPRINNDLQLFSATPAGVPHILPLNAAPAITTYSLPLSQAQQNIVRRARQQLEIRWTPLEDIVGWRGTYTFRAGNTYIGIPYAQPINQGRYIPWGASLERFINAVKDINSPMYTSFSYIGTHANIGPFYGSDCSSFVSWALNQPRRTHTGTFPTYAHRITQSIYAVEVGDVFNAPHHNLLVTAVEFDAAGNLVAIETMEQDVPLPFHRRFGAGGTDGGLQNLVDRTFGRGFHLYRSNFLADGDVPFTPSPVVNVEDGQRHIITTVAGSGGVISPGGLTPVPVGYDQRFVIHARQGYSISRVLINGTDVGLVSEWTFSNVTTDARIEVQFTRSNNPFLDVNEDDWFHDAVFHVFQQDLMRGISPTHFSPNVTTTRGMFVTILARMAGVRAEDWAFPGTVTGTTVNIRRGPSTGHGVLAQARRGDTVQIIGHVGDWYRVHHAGQTAYVFRDHIDAQRRTFTDVAPGAFYAPYAEWANTNNVTTGTGEGLFSPNQTITRQEMTTLLYRYITVMNISLQQNDFPPFPDLDTVSPWALPGVTALHRAGILQGLPGGNFNPFGHSDRASVAQIVSNFHQLYG
ncbi:MAG: S-layer homology domain-containing protein [Oscillospiraceae bacterium]|nr:S-layer homology domain-containing protein [Oscillospiraceae bacterium]